MRIVFVKDSSVSETNFPPKFSKDTTSSIVSTHRAVVLHISATRETHKVVQESSYDSVRRTASREWSACGNSKDSTLYGRNIVCIVLYGHGGYDSWRKNVKVRYYRSTIVNGKTICLRHTAGFAVQLSLRVFHFKS